jgi:uncharacterized protein YecT (DUF1311 family)
LLLPISPVTADARKGNHLGGCSNINPFAVRKCVGVRIERKERLMREQLIKARKAVARRFGRYGDNDNRSDPKFLDASQAAWKKFAENNCTVIAAYSGGSNSAISDRIMYCYEEELDRRIRFLRDVTEGTGVLNPM